MGNDAVLGCVSPGNTLTQGIIQPGDSCGPAYTPSSSNSLFSKLTFNFSIGQAF